MPCLRSIAPLWAIRWATEKLLLQLGRRTMRGLVHATMVRGFQLQLSIVWLAGWMHACRQTQEENCGQSDESGGRGQLEGESSSSLRPKWAAGKKEPVTGERAPMHCQLQLLEGQAM